jgi:transcriptional regulator with XRE-family HTH domain
MRQQRIPRGSISIAHLQLGHTVRLLRAGLRISQEDLGDRAGLHRNYVGAIERGEINPTFHTLTKLACGLDVPLSDIVRAYEQRRASDATDGYRELIGRRGEQLDR